MVKEIEIAGKDDGITCLQCQSNLIKKQNKCNCITGRASSKPDFIRNKQN